VAAGAATAARQHAHALAGAAGNLGADGLREAARDLELAASKGSADLAGLFRPVEERASVVFTSLESLRAASPPGAGAPPAQPSPPADPALLRVALQRLRSALAAGDLSGCTEVLQEVAALDGPAGSRAQVGRLRELIDGYEYDEAAQAVDRLLADLPGGGGS
jgi:HPt (histidine-containing phosphotransfer) domain-containing protein